MKRLVMAIVASTILLVPATSSARVDGTSPSMLHAMRPLGISLSKSGARAAAFAGLASTQELTYHGGPVMHSNRVYTIFWVPSGFAMTSNYELLINEYFQNVAEDSGLPTNVYWTDTEYYDTSGPIAYDVSWGGSVVDTDPFPANGCSDNGLDAYCLTEDQLIQEAYNVISYEGWPSGLGAEYFIYTPQGVGSCTDSGPSNCAYKLFCAYHSAFTDNVSDWIFAYEPFNGVPGCETGESPNNDPGSDDTINTSSHEQNESITDPFGNAWYNDTSGNEDGDDCAWQFGEASWGNPGAEFNQVIGSGHYYLQGEWSNVPGGGTPGTCEWPDQIQPANTSPPEINGSSIVGTTLTADPGTWETNGRITYSYQWWECNSTGGSCAPPITGGTSSTYTLQPADLGHTLYVVVTVTGGAYVETLSTGLTDVVSDGQRPAAPSSPPTGSRPPAPPPPPTGGRPSPP